MKRIMKKTAALLMVASMAGLTACSPADLEAAAAAVQTAEQTLQAAQSTAEAAVQTFSVGIVNYMDDESVKGVVEGIESQLAKLGEENNVRFEIRYENANEDSEELNKIVADLVADDVDLMIGVATPVEMTMQSLAEWNNIPVVFAGVSDSEVDGLIESNKTPGSNITGVTDRISIGTMLGLIFANNPNVQKVGLLYDSGQDSSSATVKAAKEYLEEKGIGYVEHTGANPEEITAAAQQMVSDGVDAVFTPYDNTVMNAESSIYDIFSGAGIPHYTGDDAFAADGAFIGLDADYATVGMETANMVKSILVDNIDPSSIPVITFDNGIATINTDICSALGLDYEEVNKMIAPYCIRVQETKTAQ